MTDKVIVTMEIEVAAATADVLLTFLCTGGGGVSFVFCGVRGEF